MWRPGLPTAELRRTYRDQGWVAIEDALETAVAAAVAESIESLRGEFRLRVRNGVFPRTLTFEEPLSDKRRLALDRQLAIAREHGLFSYLYDLFEPHPGCDAHPVCALCRFLGTPEGWGPVEAITGQSFARCEPAGVTRYQRGHYLAPHSDRLAKFGPFRRKVAYILYFCRGWEAEMGGLFALTRDGGESRALTPGFNQLLLLDVEAVGRHWVTAVERDGVERVAMPGFFSVPES